MVTIGTFLRAKRVHHLYPFWREVWRIAGAAGRGNVKGAVLCCSSHGSQWAYTLRDNGRPWLPPRLHPGSCSQREPKRPKREDVRRANLRDVVVARWLQS